MARALLLSLAFVVACGDDRLPSWATGQPPDDYDAAADRPIDAGLDAALSDAGDAGDAG